MDISTEEKILEAARELFADRGYSGVRMREIAARAGINKGLLHYYFRNKEALFISVFKESFSRFSRKLNDIMASEQKLPDKIDTIVEEYMSLLIANPNLPGFIISELHTNTAAFVGEIMSLPDRPDPSLLVMQLHLEAQMGRIRPNDPFHTVLHILSICAFPFIAKPIFQRIARLDDEGYLQLMQQRKAAIKDFIRNALVPLP
ncbi:MAG: TetR/AcrR family transcriptional regulator [Saprospiraceae bacterium]|jgi:AcrR family transcriptional regulator